MSNELNERIKTVKTDMENIIKLPEELAEKKEGLHKIHLILKAKNRNIK